MSEVVGKPVTQVLVGSCTNSSIRDLTVVAKTLEHYEISKDVSFEINPGSRQVLENITAQGDLLTLIHAGARVHQAGCLGCIGMGQAPSTDGISLRTFPRNFPGRSGTVGDKVYLCSPEVAVASAIKGIITDPRELGEYPVFSMPEKLLPGDGRIEQPWPEDNQVEVIRGPNIAPFPDFDPMPETWRGRIMLKVADNITTDHIMPAGAKILPLRSNIPAISEFVFNQIDHKFPMEMKEASLDGHYGLIVGGENYGQGSSREHAALAPRYLGVQVKIVKSFARIHKANLINFGILPLTFADPSDYESIEQGKDVVISGIRSALLDGSTSVMVEVDGKQYKALLDLSVRHREILAAGGLLNWAKSA